MRPPNLCNPVIRRGQRGTVTYLLTFRPARDRLSACLAWPESSLRVSRTTVFNRAIRHRRIRMFSSLMTTARSDGDRPARAARQDRITLGNR